MSKIPCANTSALRDCIDTVLSRFLQTSCICWPLSNAHLSQHYRVRVATIIAFVFLISYQMFLNSKSGSSVIVSVPSIKLNYANTCALLLPIFILSDSFSLEKYQTKCFPFVVSLATPELYIHRGVLNKQCFFLDQCFLKRLQFDLLSFFLYILLLS